VSAGADRDGEKQIGGGHRHADPEDEARHRAHHEQQQDVVAGELDELVGEAADLAGEGKRADDEPDPGQDRRELGEELADATHELDQLAPAPAVLLRESG
jgi:NTP pyrophosphatase (non-canonical NTP hydrolase)